MDRMQQKVNERIEENAALVRSPRSIRTKRVRVANAKDALCRPTQLPAEGP